MEKRTGGTASAQRARGARAGGQPQFMARFNGRDSAWLKGSRCFHKLTQKTPLQPSNLKVRAAAPGEKNIFLPFPSGNAWGPSSRAPGQRAASATP